MVTFNNKYYVYDFYQTSSNLMKYLNYIGRSESQKYDLSPSQFMILKEVFNQESISLSQLASNLFFDVSTISRIVSILFKKNLLLKKKHPKDKRVFLIYLSPKGLELLLYMEENLINKHEDILNQIQPQYRKIMLTVIKAYEEANRKLMIQKDESEIN